MKRGSITSRLVATKSAHYFNIVIAGKLRLASHTQLLDLLQRPCGDFEQLLAGLNHC